MNKIAAQQRYPRPLFTAEQVRELDSITINIAGIAGIELMHRAGQAVFAASIQRWPALKGINIFCGAGNNGGDGYIIAGLAAQQNIAVNLYSMVSPEKLKGDALKAYNFAIKQGLTVTVIDNLGSIKESIGNGYVLVDALLGTGLSGEVREFYQALINLVNTAQAKVVAVDIPSGVCSDTGTVLGTAIQADLTVSFIGLKRGLFTASAPAYTGEVIFDTLGVDCGCDEAKLKTAFTKVKAEWQQINRDCYLGALKPRSADAHKGMFGHVLVVGGYTGFGGAAIMAAEAAIRSGAGLTSVATRREHISALLSRLPEVMVAGVDNQMQLKPLLERASVLVIGPGLGQTDWSKELFYAALNTELPIVLDADGLNLLCGLAEPIYRDNWILTPHPGEAARLLGITTERVQSDRFTAATQLQQRYGGVVILKGAGTVISASEQKLLAKVGNPGMATAGMGDILAGLTGALLAQGLSTIEAAALAVCVHGDAADLAVYNTGQRGLLATDLIPYIRQLLNAQ